MVLGIVKIFLNRSKGINSVYRNPETHQGHITNIVGVGEMGVRISFFFSLLSPWILG